MISAAEIAGLYAIIPTPARPGSDRWDATDTVDVDETSRLVDTLIRDGVAGIIALGTMGECATLSAADFEVMVQCVVDTVAGRVPVFIGATALGTHDAIRRLRTVAARGATGSLLGLPMWQPMTTEMAVSYYRDVSIAFPDLALMVYANARAFRYPFPLDFWAGVHLKAPTVVTAKVSQAPNLLAMIDATDGRIRFLPNEMKVREFHAASPATTTGCWATAAAMGPEPALAMLKAINGGENEAIDSAAEGIDWANEPIAPILANPEVFASYNIQVEKVRIEEAGYCRPGPIRPPYACIPAEHEQAARECGRRWRELRKRLGPTAARRAAAQEAAGA